MKKVDIGNIRFIKMLSICVLCSLVFAGCGSNKNQNGSMLSDDGRSYGGLIEADMGDTVGTAFFKLTVEDAVKYNTYQFDDGLYQAEEGSTYLVVKVTIENTYAENLSMSITDFVLEYDGNKSEDIITGYGRSEIQHEDFMDNLFTLKVGESVTKNILFTVEDKDQYILKYSEYYADDFEGDAFVIQLKPEIASVTTQDSSQAGETQNNGTEEDSNKEEQSSEPTEE